MITIPIRVCGDYWSNPEEVSAQLAIAAGQEKITLDLQFEGPCLEILGIRAVIDQYCNQYQIPPREITIIRWDNIIEPVEYTVINPPVISSFVTGSRRYWQDVLPTNTHENVFGFFIGRRSIPRAVIMYDLYHKWGSQNLLSCLANPTDMPWLLTETGINLDCLDQWLPQDQQKNFVDWWRKDPIPSIDQHIFANQYSQDHNTNQDLIQHYGKFDIELVAESYTRGKSFFPTEKTIRPISAAKPMVVYGPKNFMKRLRNIGFKNYSDIWDESYDQLEGVARWQAIRQVIDTIMTLYPEDRISILQAAQKIADYNRQHLATLL
jgi:hypothetical protein